MSSTTSQHVAAHVGIALWCVCGRAMAACPIELFPTEAPTTWQRAVRDAQDHVATLTGHDCASIEVATRPSGGALLTFITIDGRRAVRALMSPEELMPALDALLVTQSPAAAVVDETAIASSATSNVVVPRNTPPSTTAPTTRVPERNPTRREAENGPGVHFGVEASAGLRLGVVGTYAAPMFGLRSSGTFGAWELGGAAEYAPAYSYLPRTLNGFSLWSFIATVQVGRRHTIAGPLALGYGAGFGVASVHEDEGGEKVADYAQPRASAYVRAVYPESARWRLTFVLGADAVLGSVRKRATLSNALPDLPRWGLTSSLGVETWLL